MVPRPVVTLVVLVLLAILAADVGAQIFIEGHTASPLIDGGIIATISGIIIGAKGPKPDEPPAPPPMTAPLPATDHRPPTGRHHSEGPS